MVFEARKSRRVRSASVMKRSMRQLPAGGPLGRRLSEQRAVAPDLGAGEQLAVRVHGVQHLYHADLLGSAREREPAGDALGPHDQPRVLHAREHLGQVPLGDLLKAGEVHHADGRV